MQEIISSRIEGLRQELGKGQKRLQELDQQQQQLRDTILRISGAIQVLEELLIETAPISEPGQNGSGSTKLEHTRP
jgi:septal ring factor EnvC (AmiA/AmiB activator)